MKCHSGLVLDALQCSGGIRSVIILPPPIKKYRRSKTSNEKLTQNKSIWKNPETICTGSPSLINASSAHEYFWPLPLSGVTDWWNTHNTENNYRKSNIFNLLPQRLANICGIIHPQDCITCRTRPKILKSINLHQLGLSIKLNCSCFYSGGIHNSFLFFSILCITLLFWLFSLCIYYSSGQDLFSPGITESMGFIAIMKFFQISVFSL